jgi:hypothetical protein
MDRLFKNLEDLLKQKIKHYESFISLFQEEWTCLSKYSYDSLQEVIEKKENKVIEIQKLENTRSILMIKIAEKLEVQQSSLTLKKIIQIKDTPNKVILTKYRKKLLYQIKKINEWSDKVKGLIDQSSLSLKKSMAYIHSAEDRATSPYMANGQMMEERAEGRMVSVDV